MWPSVRSLDMVPFSGLPVLPHHSSVGLLLQIVCPQNRLWKPLRSWRSTLLNRHLLCVRNKGVFTVVAGGLLLSTTIASAAVTALMQLPVFQPSTT